MTTPLRVSLNPPAENSGARAANPPPMPPGEIQPDQVFENIYDVPGPKP
jgi:hypothetical protein